MLKRIISMLLCGSLLFTMVMPAWAAEHTTKSSPTAFEKGTDPAIQRVLAAAHADQPTTVEQMNQMAASSSASQTQSGAGSVQNSVYGQAYELSLKYDVDQSVIDSHLLQGFTLQEMEKALQYQYVTHEDLDNVLNTMRKKEQAQATDRQLMVTSSSGFATEYDIAGLKEINVKPDQAPFALNSGMEQISTLNGALTIKATDLTLPGRNGLSFALTRTYSSGDAKFFKEDVEAYNYYPEGFKFRYDGYEYTQYIQNGAVIGSTPRIDGTFEKTYDTNVDHSNAMMWIEKNKGKEIITDSPPDSSGVITRKIQGVDIEPNVTLTRSSTGFDYYRNKASEKTDHEKMFHLGPGWSWNIPYISLGYPTKVYLGDGSSYEWSINDWYLKGYPFDDLRIGHLYDNSVQVNNEVATYVLSNTVSKIKYYFNNEGKPIQIVDAYGNTIEFHYQMNPDYGKVLWKIIDAVGNVISIHYTPSQVTLTQGDKTVIYERSQTEVKFADQPWNNASFDMLQKVKDAKGNETQYTYSMPSTSFSFTGRQYGEPAEVKLALLTKVKYPTGGFSTYNYESRSRYSGEYTYAVDYRITSRDDKMNETDSQTYNHKQFTYQNDIGDLPVSYTCEYGACIPNDYYFLVTVTDGLKTSIFANTRHHIRTFRGISYNPALRSYYNHAITVEEENVSLLTRYTYDMDSMNPNPLQVTSQYTDKTTQQTSTLVTVNKTYDSYGNVLTETDPYNIVTSYIYENGLLKESNRPLNAALTEYTEYIRNTQGKVTQLTVKDNNSSGALRLQMNYTYDAYGNPTSVVASDGQGSAAVSKEFNEAAPYRGGFLTKQTVQVHDADGNTSVISQALDYYTDTGRIKRYTNGKGQNTTYAYDQLNRVTQVTFPDTRQASVIYDDVNNTITSTDETGIQTLTDWNPLGWKTSTSIVGGGTVSYGYDQYGRMVSTTDALNHTTIMAYDNWNRLVTTTYEDGGIARIAYDDIGRTQKATDAEGNQTRQSSDLLNRVTKKEWLKPSGNITLGSYTYDYTGNVLIAIDGKNNQSTYTYGVFGRLLSVKDAKSNITNYSYNFADQLTQIQYPDLTVLQKQYDEVGRLTKKIDQSGAVEKFYYDPNGNVASYVDRKGRTFTNTYNSRNWLTYNVSSDETISYEYDGAGRRTTMTDHTGVSTYSYNAIGQLESVTYPDNRTISYVYDDLGNRTQMTDPFGNLTVYGYDALNRLSQVGPSEHNPDASYSYKKNGLLAGSTLRNGISNSYAYDGANLTALSYTKAGNTLNPFTYSYNYDNNANQTGKTENGASYSFSYDVLDRIETSSQFNETYAYDVRGNRQTQQTGNNLVIHGGSNYQYDDRNRLTQVTMNDGRTVAYSYNGDGLLYERTEEGQTTRYYYDGANMIAEGTVASGVANLRARYVRGAGLAARVDASGTKTYYMTNGHGDIVGLTDGSGNILNQYTYDLWGNPLVVEEQVQQPFRYSGEFWDSSTNLQYLRARWYDPSTGRFISQDTYEGDISNPLTLNLYTYVHNNPLRYSDPNGHWATEITANWTINEMKWQWEKAYSANNTDKMKYWAGEANKLRERMRTAGYSESDIMQSDDYSIPEAVVMDIAWASTINWIESDSLGLKLYVDAVQMIIPDPMALGTLKGPGGMKFSFSNLPKNPNELLKNGWKDVTPDGMLKNTTSREYHDEVTGFKVRFDPGKEGANGFEGMDHYHFYNPNSTGKMDYYIDKSGNPVPKGSKPSHIVP